MDANEIIKKIQNAPKKTPVKVYVKSKRALSFPNAKVYEGKDQVVFGDYEDICAVLQEHQQDIIDIEIEQSCRNSALPLLDIKSLSARIEPGAIIRDQVEIGENAVIMMGAIINVGAMIGSETMIDMGAVLGGRAIVGKRCHIGANAVLAGVIEPPSAVPVIVEDDVLIGANAVIIEGVRVKSGAIVAAGAVVIEDVEKNTIVAGVPARVVKIPDQSSRNKTAMIAALRLL